MRRRRTSTATRGSGAGRGGSGLQPRQAGGRDNLNKGSGTWALALLDAAMADLVRTV